MTQVQTPQAATKGAGTGRWCLVPNCGQPHYSRGLCSRHYTLSRGRVDSPAKQEALSSMLPGRNAGPRKNPGTRKPRATTQQTAMASLPEVLAAHGQVVEQIAALAQEAAEAVTAHGQAIQQMHRRNIDLLKAVAAGRQQIATSMAGLNPAASAAVRKATAAAALKAWTDRPAEPTAPPSESPSTPPTPAN